jgi:DNA-binding transcriptional MerR regulator
VVDTEKKYYTIGEIADLFKVSTSLIRYWEKRFKQLSPQKSKQGIRKYTSVDLAKFKIVYQLIKEKGYTIKGAQEVLKNATSNNEVKVSQEVIEHLKEIKAFLQRLQKDLE